MNKLLMTMSFCMAAVMSFFSPLNISQGEAGCCAECAIKREEEVELVYQDEENKNNNE